MKDSIQQVAGSKNTYLFVYGTLLGSMQNPMGVYLSSHALFVSSGYTQGILYDLGKYPGLVLTKNKKNQVFGEIYQIYDKVRLLRCIDEYEGCSDKDPRPHLYERRKVPVKLTSEQDIMAWTYIYKGSLMPKQRIKGGNYIAYLATTSKFARFIKAR